MLWDFAFIFTFFNILIMVLRDILIINLLKFQASVPLKEIPIKLVDHFRMERRILWVASAVAVVIWFGFIIHDIYILTRDFKHFERNWTRYIEIKVTSFVACVLFIYLTVALILQYHLKTKFNWALREYWVDNVVIVSMVVVPFLARAIVFALTEREYVGLAFDTVLYSQIIFISYVLPPIGLIQMRGIKTDFMQ